MAPKRNQWLTIESQTDSAFDLSRLDQPSRCHDLAKVLLPQADRRGFETKRQVELEAAVRAEGLAVWMAALADDDIYEEYQIAQLPVRYAERLIRKLESQKLWPSFADPQFKRSFRRVFIGAVLTALERIDDSEIGLYTIIPCTWRRDGTELNSINPKMLLEQFRSQLNRRGVAGLDGWLIAAVHGEYNPTRDCWQPHLHVLTVGEKADAIEGLRPMPLYRPSAFVRRPIVRKTLKDRAWQVSYYLAQPFWPSKWTSADESEKARERQRIPDPRHAEWLIWLDRQKFADLIWLHGCEIREGRIRAEKPVP